MAHRETDFVPYQMDCLSAAEKKLGEHFPGKDLGEVIGNHVAMFEPSYYSIFKVEDLGPHKFRDAFGATWELKPGEDIGTVIDHPLKEADLRGYSFPDPEKIMELDGIPAFIDRNRDRFIIGAIGFSLYERAWILRGIEPVLMDLIENPSFIETLFDRIVEFNLAITKRLCRFPIDAFHFGDDWGQQHGLVMSPGMWRRIFKKRLKRLYGAVRDAGLPVSIHSCGDITEIIPDLIEIGVNMITPFQAEAMDVAFLKREYGRDLTFWGGVSTQKTMPYGTPDDVRAEVRERIRVVGKGGDTFSPLRTSCRGMFPWRTCWPSLTRPGTRVGEVALSGQAIGRGNPKKTRNPEGRRFRTGAKIRKEFPADMTQPDLCRWTVCRLDIRSNHPVGDIGACLQAIYPPRHQGIACVRLRRGYGETRASLSPTEGGSTESFQLSGPAPPAVHRRRAPRDKAPAFPPSARASQIRRAPGCI